MSSGLSSVSHIPTCVVGQDAVGGQGLRVGCMRAKKCITWKDVHLLLLTYTT